MPASCAARSPGRGSSASIASAALELAGVHAVFTAADLNPGVHEAWFALAGKDVPDSPRPPLAEDEVRFVGDLVALVVAEDRYIAEDAADLVDVEYDPLTAVVDYATAETNDELVFDGWAGNVCGRVGRAPGRDSWPPCSTRRRSSSRRRSTNRPTSLRRWRRGASSSSGRAADQELTVWAASQSPHDLRMFAARLLAVPENRIRVIARDTGGAFGQKINPHREDICMLLAASKVPAALKYIEDRRENLMASSSRREHGRVRMAFDADGTYQAATIDLVQDIGAYPIPWPVVRLRRRRDDLSRPVPTAERDVHHQVRVHQHTRAHRVPRAVAVRDRRPRDDARHRRPPPRRRPRRPTPAQPAAPRRDALRQCRSA